MTNFGPFAALVVYFEGCFDREPDELEHLRVVLDCL